MMKTRNMVLLSVGFVLLIIIIANFMFTGNVITETIELREGELHKNMGLTLLPGETYRYGLGGEALGDIEFKTKVGYDCIGIYINDDYSGVCINSDGVDEAGSNLSFSHPQIIFFKPWMLALEDGWKWNVEYMDKQTGNTILEYDFEVTGEENVLGRDCYVVQINGADFNVTEWVDKEKRILIKESGSDYEISIVEAPFELEN